jgi:cobalamin biosynthesis protein CobD/CbiB
VAEELDPFESFEQRAQEVRELQTRRAESKRRRRAWYRKALGDAVSTALGTVLAAVVIVLGGSVLGLIHNVSRRDMLLLLAVLALLVGTIMSGARLFQQITSEEEMLADIEREEAVRYFREARIKREQTEMKQHQHTSSTGSDATGRT